MLIEAELTRQASCGSLMAEFRMRRKPSMRQPREMWKKMERERERSMNKAKKRGVTETENAGKERRATGS